MHRGEYFFKVFWGFFYPEQYVHFLADLETLKIKNTGCCGTTKECKKHKNIFCYNSRAKKLLLRLAPWFYKFVQFLTIN